MTQLFNLSPTTRSVMNCLEKQMLIYKWFAERDVKIAEKSKNMLYNTFISVIISYYYYVNTHLISLISL